MKIDRVNPYQKTFKGTLKPDKTNVGFLLEKSKDIPGDMSKIRRSLEIVRDQFSPAVELTTNGYDIVTCANFRIKQSRSVTLEHYTSIINSLVDLHLSTNTVGSLLEPEQLLQNRENIEIASINRLGEIPKNRNCTGSTFGIAAIYSIYMNNNRITHYTERYEEVLNCMLGLRKTDLEIYNQLKETETFLNEYNLNTPKIQEAIAKSLKAVNAKSIEQKLEQEKQEINDNDQQINKTEQIRNFVLSL